MGSWNAADIPSQEGRTVVVTGANSGIGLAAARELARAPWERAADLTGCTRTSPRRRPDKIRRPTRRHPQ